MPSAATGTVTTAAFVSPSGRHYMAIDGREFKIPFRYNRPMVRTEGGVSVFELALGDRVRVEYHDSQGVRVADAVSRASG